MKYTVNMQFGTPLWMDMWEYLCDHTPTTGTFHARKILMRAGRWNKDYIGAFLEWCITNKDGDHLMRVSRGVYKWVFAR